MAIAIATTVLLSPNAEAQSIDLRPLFPKAKHQGDQNTCSAFAATALMEYLIKRDLNKDLDLSESYAFWAGKNLAPESDFVRALYANTDGLAGYLAVRAFHFGAILEEDWRYDSPTTKPPRDPALIGHGMRPVYIPRENIAAYMVENHAPVVMNIMFYFKLFNKDGDAERTPSKIEKTACLKEGKDCGGHVVLLVGYDASTQRFIFRNSWGPEWGSNGYGTLPVEYVIKHCESCYNLATLSTRTEEERQFIQKTSMGVSGTLTLR